MQLNILEIAQKLIDELLEQGEHSKQRAEGVAMLFHRLQEAHAEALKALESTAATEEPKSDGQ